MVLPSHLVRNIALGKKMGKTFSILIPVFNRASLVGKTIDSILKQTYTNFEIIVIDDGSTDQTDKVLKEFGNQISVLRQENQGPTAARHKAASVAVGDYLVLLDSDDLLLPWALSTYKQIIDKFNSPSLIIGSLLYFKDGQLKLESRENTDKIEVYNYKNFYAKDVSVGLSCSNIVINKTVFNREVGDPKKWLRFQADEHDIVLRFGLSSGCVIVKQPATVGYRLHDGNCINDIQRMAKIGIAGLIRSELRGYYPGGFLKIIQRYSIIGGMALCWVERAQKAKKYSLALYIFAIAFPMILGGIFNKILYVFHRLARKEVL
jgi:glycosyltransferase involved in cell wall biosynthesis